MTWLITYWPVVSGILLLASPIASGIFLLWLRSQFLTRQAFELEQKRIDADIKKERDRVDLMQTAHLLLEGRIKAVEDHCNAPPSRGQLAERLSGLGERLAGVEKGLTSLETIGGTTNDYLQILIEKGVRS